MKKYIVYDSETGGLDPTTSSLLTLTLRVLDQQLQQLEQLELKLKPEDGIFKVSMEAMGINKINLVEHEKTAITYKEARPRIMALLNRHSNGGISKLVPIGQNVEFDNAFIYHYLITKSDWEILVSYKKLDTATIAEFLKLCNLIPVNLRGLGDVASFFGVKEAGAHNATVDVNMTQNVLKAMKMRVTHRNFVETETKHK